MPFVKGKSGNPAGRPKGIKDKRVKYQKAIEDCGGVLFEKAKEMALEGNEQMLKLILERFLPGPRKDTLLPDTGLNVDAPLSEQAKNLVQLAYDQVITPDQAEGMLKNLNSTDNIINSKERDRMMFEILKQK